MGVALRDLVETALRVAKQALGKQAGKPDSGRLAREAQVKRTQDSALRSRFWYRPFCEIILLFAFNNIKKLAKTL